MKRIFLLALLATTLCNHAVSKTRNDMETKEHYAFAPSEKVTRQQVEFKNRCGITLVAERGFLTIIFNPSYTGESDGEPRYVASSDINTEDFCAAVDYLSPVKTPSTTSRARTRSCSSSPAPATSICTTIGQG